MYTSWPHYYIPKIDGMLSFMINPFFIWIILSDIKMKLGNYRYLLCYFSSVNIFCSFVDIMVPMILHDYKYAFMIIISDGLFVKRSRLNTFLLVFRCSCVPATYAILHSHFLYRYMLLYHKQFLNRYFLPYGLLLSFFYTMLTMAYWIFDYLFLLVGDDERKDYMRDEIMDVFGANVTDLNILIALYSEGSPSVVHKSWIAIILVSTLSMLSVMLLFLLGVLIIRGLNNQGVRMSPKTRKLQKQLMKALVVQSVIPTVLSFSPTMFAWYQPIFAVKMVDWLEDVAVIAVTIFPFLDPMAIIVFVPIFRTKLTSLVQSSSSESIVKEEPRRLNALRNA